MARIPDYDAAGETVARATTPRFADRSRQIRADGQQALAGAVGGVLQDISEHDDKLRYAAARSTMLKAQQDVRKELEADNSDGGYQKFESLYRDRLGKSQQEASKMIRGQRSRQLFEADAAADLERGAEQIRGIARAKETDQGLALLNGTLDANRAAILEAKTEDERVALLQSSGDLIQGAFDRNYIDARSRQDVSQKFTRGVADAFIGIQSPAKRVELLSNPDSNFARFLPADRRQSLLKAAERDNNDLRVRAESQVAEDQIVASTKGDFRAALTAARDIKDPEVRDSTVTRIKARQAEAKQFEIEDRESAGEEALSFLNGGGNYADLPLTIKNRLRPSALNSLRSYSEAGGKTRTAPETLIELSSMSADEPQAFGELNMLEYRDKLSDQDFEEFVDLQRKIRTGQLDGKATGFQNIVQVRNDRLRELFGATSAKGEKQEKISAFTVQFEGQLKAFKEANGRPAKAEDARKILDDLTAEVVTTGFLGFSGKKKAYQLDEDDVDVPKADRESIIRVLRATGRPVTTKEILRMYTGANAEPRRATVPASTTPVSDAIRALEASEGKL